MRLRAQLVSLLLVGIVAGCASSPPERAGALSEAPAIVIRQYADYPMPGRGSEFASGLVAALWRDGRMIRPASADAIGKSYVEGVVSPAQRDAFFAFLSGSAAVRAPEGGGIPVDGAAQSITVRRDGVAATWTRGLPDTQSAWREVVPRLLALPMHGSRPVAWAAVRSASWYDSDQQGTVEQFKDGQQDRARAIAAVNRQIEKISEEPKVIKTDQRVVRIEYSAKDGRVVCFDQDGKAFLTLERREGGRFEGVFTTPAIGHSFANGRGCVLASMLCPVYIEEKDLQ